MGEQISQMTALASLIAGDVVPVVRPGNTDNFKFDLGTALVDIIADLGSLSLLPNLAALKAYDTTKSIAFYSGATWFWTLGDYTGLTADSYVVKSDAFPIATGAWVSENYSGVRLQSNSGLAIGKQAGILKVNQVADSDDVFIGYLAGVSMPSGPQSFSTMIGAFSCVSATSAAGVVAVGQKALITATTISSTVSIGSKSGSALPTAASDVFVGYAAAQFSNATNIGGRVFIGYNAGQYDNGDYSIAIGYFAGAQTLNGATTATSNICIGGVTLNTVTGSNNIAIGYQAGAVVTSGSSNILLGFHAGYTLTTGINNLMIGSNAGFGHTNSSRNIFLGSDAGFTVPNGSQFYFVAGADGNEHIDHVYFGKGYSSATPTAYTIHGSGGSGSNIAGADVKIAGGMGTGTGASGKVILQIAPAGSSGTAANALADAVTVNTDKSAVFAGPITLSPGASVTPASNGQVTFELTSNTTLTIRAKGSDGTVRSGTVTLS